MPWSRWRKHDGLRKVIRPRAGRCSLDFYHEVFGWRLRQRGDGLMVDNIRTTIAAIIPHGCEIAQPLGAAAPELTARFRDLVP